MTKPLNDYPDVDIVLLKPTANNDQELHVDREQLQSAIKRARVTVDNETLAVTLSLSESEIIVTSRDRAGNTAKEVIAAKFTGPQREVHFNYEHLLSMLKMMDSKLCTFFLGPDRKRSPCPLLLKDAEVGMVGTINQLRV